MDLNLIFLCIVAIAVIIFIAIFIIFIVKLSKDTKKLHNFVKHDTSGELSKTPILIECKVCHNKISSAAKICPQCGQPISFTTEEIKNEEIKNKNNSVLEAIFIAIFVILIIMYLIQNDGVIPLFTIKGEGDITFYSE